MFDLIIDKQLLGK